MTYHLKIFSADDVTDAERELAARRFRTALEETLDKAMAMPADELLAMGRRGYDLVKSRYAWDQVAAEMKAVYLWLCGKGPKPACVQNG